MTPQQARAAQVKHYEFLALANRCAARVTREQFGKSLIKRSYIRYCERTARANRNAIRRHAS